MAVAPENSTGGLPVISSTTGDSSRRDSTRFPAAKVLCKVAPRAARATTGPKEPMRVRVAMRLPEKPRSWEASKSIPKSSRSITAPVTAAFPPAAAFMAFSTWDRAAVRLSIS